MEPIRSLIEFPTTFTQRRRGHDVVTNSTYQTFQLGRFVVRHPIFVPTSVKTDPNSDCCSTVDVNLTSIGSTKLLMFHVSYPCTICIHGRSCHAVADAPESSNHQNSDCPSFQHSDKSGSKTGMYLRSSCETETVSCTFKNVEVAVLFKTTLLLTSETNPWENSAASPVEPSPCKPKNHGSCRFGGAVQLDSC